MQDKIKCAIVGLGRIASSLEDDKLREKPASHAGAVSKHPNCELIAGADLEQQKREAFKKRWGVSLVFENAEQLLAQTKPQILNIATPPESHLEILKLALKHKVPVIICEKPLAPNLKEGQKILKLASKSCSKIVINHERRYSNDYIYTKECIDSKKYGELLSIHSKLFMGKKRAPAQMLLDDGTHLLDILRFLSGSEFKKIKTFGNAKSDTGTLFIKALLGKTLLSIELASKRDYLCFESDLFFESGRIRIGNGLFEEYQSEKSPYYEHFNSLKLVQSNCFNKTNYFYGMMQDAVKCFLEKPYCPKSSLKDGFESLNTIQRILKKLS